MADIKSYPRIGTLKGLDTLICTETYDANADDPVVGGPTKTVTVDQITSFVANATGTTPEEKTITLDLGPLTNSNISKIISTLFKIDPTGGAVIEPYGKIGDWDVSGVTNMTSFFYYQRQFNQDISSWDVSNVTNMLQLFCGAHSFNQDISGWDVSNVSNMRDMFRDATVFNKDISEWDVSSVINMGYMFYDATIFNKDLSGWDVDQVEDYNYFSTYAYNWTLSKPNFTFI